jgi:hypothetical protein
MFKLISFATAFVVYATAEHRRFTEEEILTNRAKPTEPTPQTEIVQPSHFKTFKVTHKFSESDDDIKNWKERS